MAKTVRISLSKIPIGIRYSLQNSRRINHTAKALLLDWKPIGNMTIRQHHSKYAIILFYYSIEELGKALYLDELKQNAESNNVEYVESDKLFSDHDVKINKAQEKYPELKIPNWKEESIGEKMFKLVPHDEVVKGFMDRSNFFLVGFDEDNQEWINDISSKFDDDEILKRIELLDSILDELQEKYDKLFKEFTRFDYYETNEK